MKAVVLITDGSSIRQHHRRALAHLIVFILQRPLDRWILNREKPVLRDVGIANRKNAIITFSGVAVRIISIANNLAIGSTLLEKPPGSIVGESCFLPFCVHDFEEMTGRVVLEFLGSAERMRNRDERPAVIVSESRLATA